MNQIYLAGVALLATLAVAATLYPSFQDSLVQRIGLGLVSIGGAGEAVSLVVKAATSQNATAMLIFGCAVYAVGASLQTINKRRKQ